MTVNDAADKLDRNPVLAALAKVAMFLTPILVSIALFVLGYWLNSQAQAQQAISSRVAITEQFGAGLDKRVTVLEDASTRGRADSLQFQDRSDAAFDELRRQNLQILQALASITARLDEGDKQRAAARR